MFTSLHNWCSRRIFSIYFSLNCWLYSKLTHPRVYSTVSICYQFPHFVYFLEKIRKMIMRVDSINTPGMALATWNLFARAISGSCRDLYFFCEILLVFGFMRVAETLYLLLGIILLAKLALKNIHKKMEEVKLEGSPLLLFLRGKFYASVLLWGLQFSFRGIFDIVPRIFHSREVFYRPTKEGENNIFFPSPGS